MSIYGDDADRADAEIERATTEALRLAKRRAAEAAKAPEDWDGKTCYDCEVELPPNRVEGRLFRCVGCQTEVERRNKMRKG